MKFLFDMFPILLFFVAYYATGNDIFIATGVTIGATTAQVGWTWFRHRKVDTMLWVSFALVTVLGGATLLLHNKTFIMWKPTALYWVFALTLLVAPSSPQPVCWRKAFTTSSAPQMLQGEVVQTWMKWRPTGWVWYIV